MIPSLIRSTLRRVASKVPVGTALPIVVGPLAGMKWYAGAAAGGGNGLSVCFNLSEPRQLRKAAELSRGADLCFDFGANAGQYSLLFSRNAKRVVAVEPLPRNLDWLRQVLDLNNAANVTVIAAAVTSSCGAGFLEQGENCALGKLASCGIPVACVTADSIAADSGMPAVIKIDVEGAELEVLHGAENILKSRHPAILLSTHGAAVKQQCMAYLSRFHYRMEPFADDENDFYCF